MVGMGVYQLSAPSMYGALLLFKRGMHRATTIDSFGFYQGMLVMLPHGAQ